MPACQCLTGRRQGVAAQRSGGDRDRYPNGPRQLAVSGRSLEPGPFGGSPMPACQCLTGRRHVVHILDIEMCK
jgi:hypothetical protein